MSSRALLSGGDALEDDFVPDDLVALSGDESYAGQLDSADDAGEHSENEPAPRTLSEDTKATKKRKRREKEKERKAKKVKLTSTANSNAAEGASVATGTPEALAAYLRSKQLKTYKDLSDIELEDKAIPDSAITDTTSWTGPRSLDHIVEFITKTLPTLHTRLGQKPKNNGAPTLLYVCGAALRVTDVTRALKTKKLLGEKGGDIAKLFARHFKLEDHVAYLRRTKLAAAVGTPGRIGKLLYETDSLGVGALTHIILDISFHDAKKRSILDIPETRDELFKFVLGAPQIMKAIRDGKLQIVLF